MVAPLTFLDPPDVREFVDPYGRPYDPSIGWSPGGIALNDGTQGREVQLWNATFDDSAILLNTEFGGFQGAVPVFNVSAVSLAFDGNMQPVLAYMAPGGEYLRFFDASVSNFVTIVEPLADSALVALDDNRDATAAASDVIWAYTKGGNLYYRVQRERYEIERLIGPAKGPLINMGPNNSRRLQFRLNPG